MAVVAMVAALPTVAVTDATVATPEAEAIGTTTSATTYTAASMPAKGSMRSTTLRELPTSTTTMGSPPI
jgi:hypothetical protein